MRKIWIISLNEFLNHKRSKIFLVLVLFLALKFALDLFSYSSMGVSTEVYIYDRIISVLSNPYLYSLIISIFCAESMFRNIRSREIDIFYSLNTSSTQYYIGRALGSFLFYLPTFFVLSLLTLAEDISVFHITGWHIDLNTPAGHPMLYWFVLGFITKSVIAIAYGVVLPIALSSFFEKSLVLFIPVSLSILTLLMPSRIITLLRYVYWTYDPYYSEYFMPEHTIAPSLLQALISFLCIVGILLAIFITGLVKYRHNVVNDGPLVSNRTT